MARHHSLKTNAQSGFTLAEMAIVLVIVGLLVAVVVGGSSLLQQSKLQTAIADYSKYSAAVAQFTRQYGGPPGDIIDATNYWGKDTANCNADSAAAGSPGTCNGDGNGVIGSNASSSEMFRAWQQLQLAKMVDGTFSGTASSNATVFGTNAPASRILNAGWGFFNNTSYTGNADWYAQDVSNVLMLGSTTLLSTYIAGNTLPVGPVLTPTEAWQIDKKMDDGLPASGRIVALKPTSSGTPNCTTSATDASAAYNRTLTTAECNLNFSLTLK